MPTPLFRRSTGSVALAVLGFVSACNPHDTGSRRAAVDTASWQLSERPILRVGNGKGAGQELEHVYGGLIGRNGGVVVGNSGTGELRFFDAAGRLTRVAGRKGAGPGEFQGIHWIRRFRGDSILVFDFGLQRFSVWSDGGAFGRSFQIAEARGLYRPVAVVGGENVLVSAENNYDPRSRAGLVRDEMRLALITLTGEPAGTIGRFPGAEWLLYKNANSFRATQFPFGRMGFVDATDEHIFYASSDSPSVHVYDRAGRLLKSLQIPAAPRRMSRAEIDSVLREIPDEGARQEVGRALRRGGSPSTAISGLGVDGAGNVWVRTPASAPGTSRWTVLSASAGPRGSLLVPDAYVPLELDVARLLLRETDRDGVERVAVREVTQ
jgi:hypothetical protein